MEILRNRKALGITFIFLCVFGVIFFIINFTFLTIKTPNESTNIIVRNNDFFKEFSLDKNSKTFLVRRSSYTIEAQKGDQLSLYSKSLGLFSNSIEVSTFAQKGVDYIGKNSLLCSLTALDLKSSFYPCRVDTLGITDSEEQPNEQTDRGDGGALKHIVPYGDGFLDAQNTGNTLVVKKVSISGDEVSSIIKFENATKEASDNTLSVESQGSSFTVFNEDIQTIYKYKNYEDKNPIQIQLPNGIDKELLDLRIINTADNVYIFNYSATIDRLEDTDESIEDNKDKFRPSQVYIYDNSAKLIKKYNLPKEWQLRTISGGPNNNVVFYLSGNLNNQAFIIKSDKKPERLPIPDESPQQVCWANEDSFYYLSNSGTNIFQYNLSSQKSDLIYSGLIEGANIVNLNCVKGVPQIAIVSENDGNINQYAHYILNSNNHTGTRPESLLPLYFDWQQNTYKIAITSQGLVVQSVYISDSATSNNRESVLKQAEQQITSKGIDLKTNPLSIAY